MGDAYHVRENDSTYFLTFQVVGWIDIFTRQRYRDIVVDAFNYCIENKGLVVYAWVIMSNHVHCVVSSKTGKLADTIRDLKAHTSRQILKSIVSEWESRAEWMLIQFKKRGLAIKQQYQFWTHENHAIHINELQHKMLATKINYIHQNPVRARIVANPEDYIYSSAIDYYTGKKGLISVELVVG